jgi:hypothetical protein
VDHAYTPVIPASTPRRAKPIHVVANTDLTYSAPTKWQNVGDFCGFAPLVTKMLWLCAADRIRTFSMPKLIKEPSFAD